MVVALAVEGAGSQRVVAGAAIVGAAAEDEDQGGRKREPNDLLHGVMMNRQGHLAKLS